MPVSPSAESNHWRIENSKGHPLVKCIVHLKGRVKHVRVMVSGAGLVFGVHLAIQQIMLET